MLNELYDVAMSLQSAGITAKNWDKEYVPLRRPNLAYFVFIDEKSEITNIERVTEQIQVESLRKWESKGDLRQSFPYFNVPPLFWIRPDPEQDEYHRTIRKALKANNLDHTQLEEFIRTFSTGNQFTEGWDDNAKRKLKGCMDKGKALKTILGVPPQECLAMVALIDRVAFVTVEQFHSRFQEALIRKVCDCSEAASLYFEGLFYRGKKLPNPNTVTLLLELADGLSRFEFPVKHTKVRDWINERLRSRAHPQDVDASVRDVFDNSGLGSAQPFDDVRMRNALGNVKLRSMAKEASCQLRYRRAEADSCLVGQDSRSKMKGALEWLSDPAREGKTWVSMSRAKDSSEILFVYPSVLPPDPPNAAEFFGGTAANDPGRARRFEDCAANVTGAFSGLMANNPDLDLRVFALRKMDAARTRVASHRRYAAKRVIACAGEWQKGCHNLPHILIKQFDRDGNADWKKPATPYPMEAVWVLNTCWSRQGEPLGRARSLTWQDGIALILEGADQLAHVLFRALYSVTRNLLGLVLALGQAHAEGRVFSVDKNFLRHPTILPCVLGLLLYRLTISKEEYMKSAPYLVGRLLSLADQLHFQYCQKVREGGVPPQLMGNALMATALEEPVKALAVYANRILPYQAWAKTVSGESAGLARYFLSELGKVSADISQTTLPARFQTS